MCRVVTVRHSQTLYSWFTENQLNFASFQFLSDQKMQSGYASLPTSKILTDRSENQCREISSSCSNLRVSEEPSHSDAPEEDKSNVSQRIKLVCKVPTSPELCSAT